MQHPVGESHDHMTPGHYGMFFSMIVASTLLMFGLMYLNTFELDHVFFSETRAYMALLVGAAMTMVMLASMWEMYPDKTLNRVIIGASLAVFALSLWLVRSQQTVDDSSYMRAMIPHHSIAILTSTRAQLKDPRVRRLADSIVTTQRREIAEMKSLIDDLQTKK